MVDNSNKKLKDLRPYLKFFDFSKLTHKEDLILSNASVFDTLRNIEKVVKNTIDDTKEIAKHLKSSSLEQTLRNNWHFVHDHIAYQLDKIGVEQIRRPLRLIYDKKGDCDCFSTFFSSLLTNQGIEHSLRMTKYKNDWQHVYVIVPQKHGKKEYYTLDAVLHEFDKEEPFTQKHDKKMNLTVLNGLGNLGNLAAIEGLGFTQEFNTTNLLGLGYVVPNTDNQIMADFLARLKQHLYNTKRIIETHLSNFDGGFVAELNYLLDNFDTNFYGALDTLANGQIGSLHGLGFFKKLKKSVQSVAKKVGSGVKKAAKATANVAKKVGKAIVKYNPLTILIRNGFYLALRINFLNIAGRLYYGSLSEQEAQNQGLDMNEYRKLKNVFNKTKGLLVGIGANESNFYKWFNKGVEVARRKGKIGSGDTTGASDDTATLEGFISKIKRATGRANNNAKSSIFSSKIKRATGRAIEGLGEPATATGVAAASGILAKIWSWLKDIDFSKLKKRISTVKNIFDTGKNVRDNINSFLPPKNQDTKQEVQQDQNLDIEPTITAPTIEPTITTIEPQPRTAYEPVRSTANAASDEKKSNMGLIVGGVAAATVVGLLVLNGKSKPTKSKKSLNGTEGLEGTKKKTATKRKVKVKI